MTDSRGGHSITNGGGQSRLQIPGFAPVRGLGVDRTGALVEAREIQSGARVVIRVLSPALAADNRFIRRFRKEAGRLSTLQHPNLVRVIRFDPNAKALITEFAGGVTLRRLIDGSGPLSPEAAFVLLGNIVAALGALHATNVLHRDLRPEVILIDPAGAVRVRDAGIPAPPLHAGWTAGTPRYLAPELWNGGIHTPSSDLYAASAILFESLTGRPPFEASDLSGLRKQHESAQISEESLPPSARSLVVQGLEKDPNARPQRAAEVQRDLQTAAASFFEDGWHQAGETWLSEAAAARLMEPAPVERTPIVIPEGEMESAPPPAPEPRTPSRVRRRLALIGAVGSAAFAALCVVVIGVALLGHGGGTPAATNSSAADATPSPSLLLETSPSTSSTVDETPTPSASPTNAPTDSQTVPPTASSTTTFNTVRPTPTHTPKPPTPTPTPTHTPTACPLPPPICA